MADEVKKTGVILLKIIQGMRCRCKIKDLP
jgi:hypothetical protein